MIFIYEIWELLSSKNGSVPSCSIPLESLNSIPTSTVLPSLSELQIMPFGTVVINISCFTIGKKQDSVSYFSA